MSELSDLNNERWIVEHAAGCAENAQNAFALLASNAIDRRKFSDVSTYAAWAGELESRRGRLIERLALIDGRISDLKPADADPEPAPSAKTDDIPF